MRKVLVVDDEEEAVEVLSDCLIDMGFSAKAVLDGKDALERLERDKFDLLILDLQMPNVNGEDVLKVVSEKYKDLPVIVMTGYSDGGVTKTRIHKYNIEAYIEKPINLDLLECVIREIKEKRKL